MSTGKNVLKQIIIALTLFALPGITNAAASFKNFVKEFVQGYNQLQIPALTYNYRDYFSTIPAADKLKAEEDFFTGQLRVLGKYDSASLKGGEWVEYYHLFYEINLNLQRVRLEKQWALDGRRIPDGGLYGLKDHENWYRFFIELYSSTGISPEEVNALGKAEVGRVKNEIKKIQIQSGFADSVGFYDYLKSDTFYITDKKQIIAAFQHIGSMVRLHLPAFTGNADIPPVYAMQWPDAGPSTPPGMYLNHIYNAYGKDVFQFNLYSGKYNRRAMEWLYMHEAIPGHHLQASFRDLIKNKSPLQDLFSYPGNFEGWACFVEYLGKDFGLYTDPYSYLGKWEWDLVRSARLVMDVGIHYYGWTHQQALDYWKATIPGQDDIAEREVSRVTNWPAQALSYKTGADFIFKLKDKWQKKYPTRNLKDFYRSYLEAGMIPLVVMEKKLLEEN